MNICELNFTRVIGWTQPTLEELFKESDDFDKKINAFLKVSEECTALVKECLDKMDKHWWNWWNPFLWKKLRKASWKGNLYLSEAQRLIVIWKRLIEEIRERVPR